MALTTIPSELSSVSGISDSSSSTAITIDSSQNVTFAGNITTGSNTISGVLSSVTGSIGSAATATTQAASDNSTKLATTAYVTTALANLVDSAPGTLNTLNELAAALGDDANFSTTVTTSLAAKANLAAPNFTGNVTFDTSTLVVDSVNDRVGIGTTTPSVKLHVRGSAVSGATFNADDGLTIEQAGGGGSNINLISSTNTGVLFSDAAARAVGLLNYSHSDNSMRFNTNGSEAMRIDSSGNLAIGGGYTTPKEKLHIVGAAVFDGNHATATNAFRADEGVLIHGAGNVGYITAVSNGNNDVDLQLRALNGGSANSNQIVLDSEGAVGIGASPASGVKFQAVNTTGDQWVGDFKHTHADAYGLRVDLSGSTSSTRLAFATYTGGGTGFFVRNDGVVGIGTTGPLGKLHVSGAEVFLQGGNTTTGPGIFMGDSNFANASYYNSAPGIGAVGAYGGVAGGLAFYYYGGAANARSEGMRIAGPGGTAGNVGIGTQAPIAKLDILGLADHQIFVRSHAGNNTTRYGGVAGINRAGNQLAMVHYYADAGTNYQSYGAPLGSTSYRGPTQHRFYVASGPDTTTHYEKMRLTTSGLVIGSANVGGTTSADIEIINDSSGTFAFRRNEGAISNGEVIGQHYYTGDDPSATKTAHLDRVSAIGNWSANNYPVKRSFWFDQGGNLLQSWYIYRATDGNVISEHIAGTNASASMRLSNDAITWQVDCRTDDHFAIYNQTSAATRLFISTAGKTKFGDGDVTGTAMDSSGTVSNLNNSWTWAVINTTTSGEPHGILCRYLNSSPNSTSSHFFLGMVQNTSRFQLRSNGGLANITSNDVNLSDEREKKNIEDSDSQWSVLKNIKIRKFHYNDDDDSDKKRFGVIAQEIEPHAPDVVTNDWEKQPEMAETLWEEGEDLPEGVSVGDVKSEGLEQILRKAVQEQQVTWMAIKALQEAMERIETLEAEVAALKGE